jgi:hypothetical protein
MNSGKKGTDPLPEGFITARAAKTSGFPECFELKAALGTWRNFTPALAIFRFCWPQGLAEVFEEGPDGKLEEIAAWFPVGSQFTGAILAQVMFGHDTLHRLPYMNLSVFFAASFAEHAV